MATPLHAVTAESRQAPRLPLVARKMLRSHRVPLVATIEDERGVVIVNPDPTSCAASFLGIGKSIAYTKGKLYVARVGPLMAKPIYDSALLLPKRTRTGGWAEIPCEQFGNKYICRTDRIVWMLFPEIGWPS